LKNMKTNEKMVNFVNNCMQVIDEMLRRTNIAFSLFREATKDVNINGSFIFISNMLKKNGFNFIFY